MNRRDFLKIGGAALLAAILPTEKMAKALEVEVEMNLGDVMAKIGRGVRLTGPEQEFLRIAMNRVQSTSDIVSGWSARGATPNINAMNVGQMNIDLLPNGGAYLYASSVTIPTLVTDATELTLSVKNVGNDWVILPNADDATRWDFNPLYVNQKRTVLCTGNVLWEGGDADGVRAVYIGVYKKSDDSSVTTYWLNLNAASTTNSISFSLASAPIDFNSDHYLRFKTYQDSGGDQNITYIGLSVFAVR